MKLLVGKVFVVAGLFLAVAGLAGAEDGMFSKEEISKLTETSTGYVNGRNLSQYLDGTERPVQTLEQISGASSGKYAKRLIEDFVAYEDAIGGRDFGADNSVSKYRKPELTKSFSDFYGLNGANAENPDEPITANKIVDAIEGDMPKRLAENPEQLKALQQKNSEGDFSYDDEDVSDLAKRTKLSSEKVEAILKAMDNNKLQSPAILKILNEADPKALAFIRDNFPAELKETKRLRENSERHFTAYHEDIAEYQKFLADMESENFSKQFQEYAKFFTNEQKAQAIQPYATQAKVILDRAKVNYQLGLRELEYMQQYLDRFYKQKLIPKMEEHNRQVGKQSSSVTTPIRFGGGIFAFAANATNSTTGANSGSTSFNMGDLTTAISSEVGGFDNGGSSTSGSDNGFAIDVQQFSTSGNGGVADLSTSSSNVATTDTAETSRADATKAASGSFSKAQGSKSGDLSPVPTNALSRYVRVADFFKGGSYKPLCDDTMKGATGSNSPVTRSGATGDCVDRLNKTTAFATPTNDLFGLVKTDDGGTAADSNRQVGLTKKAATNNSLGSLFESKSKATNAFLNNRKGDGVVLSRSQVDERHAKQQEAVNEKTGGGNAKISGDAYTKDGKQEYKNFNPAYSSDPKKAEEEAIELGHCLMIEDEDGAYKISKNSSYNSTIKDPSDPRAKKYNLGSGKSASVQRITDPSHPFSPRHKAEWQDLPNPLNSLCGGGQQITQVCGTDKKDRIGGVYAWQKALGVGWDRGEYKQSIVDNEGKIMSTPARVAAYSTAGYAAYYVCMAATSWYGGDTQLCCDTAEQAACQLAILPPVKPINKLALTYSGAHLSDSSDSGSSGGSNSGSASEPHLYTNSYDTHKVGGKTNKGYNWKSNFGFDGPWTTSVATGKVGFGQIEDDNKEDYKMWATSLAGVNPGYSISEDNNSAPEAHNLSCGTGGWEELKRYQENCARVIGVNCICDPKVFYEKTAQAYVLSRYSGVGLKVDDKEREEVVTREINGEKVSYRKDVTDRVNWPAVLKTNRDGVPMMASYNDDVGGKEGNKFPGGETQKGLSHAKAGSMIVYQEPTGDELTEPDKTHGQKKRPMMIASVESVNSVTGCIIATTTNNPSVFMDSCGGTENLGKVTEFQICPPNMKGKSQFNYPGGKTPDCADNNEYYTCQETQAGWNAWDVKNPYTSKFAAIDDDGKLVENANCEQYHDKINAYRKEVDGSQTGVSRMTEIKEQIELAQAKGCPPDPRWGVGSSSYSAQTRSSQNEYAIVPATSSEQGAPLNFDFFGAIGSFINKFTDGKIFPAIKEGAATLGTVTGGGSGGEK